MTSWFDKWGLSPQERRFVVIVGILVFILVNWWVIFPMFGDWGRFENKLDYTRKKIEEYKAEIKKRPDYEKKRAELKLLGSDVSSEDAALRLQQDVISQANLVGLGYGTITPVNRGGTTTSTKTNYFDEASVNVSINTGEKELVNFLVRLADKDLLIRAKSMDIGPDLSQTRLQGNLTLVKSFQRKPATPPRSTTTTAAKPAAAPPASTAATPPPTQPTSTTALKVQTPPAVAPATSPTPARATSPGGNTNAVTIPTRQLPKPLK